MISNLESDESEDEKDTEDKDNPLIDESNFVSNFLYGIAFGVIGILLITGVFIGCLVRKKTSNSKQKGNALVHLTRDILIIKLEKSFTFNLLKILSYYSKRNGSRK